MRIESVLAFLEVIGTAKLAVIAFLFVMPFVLYPLAFATTKRWDQAWMQRWEARHHRSLETLRAQLLRTLKFLIIARWGMFALFFTGLGFTASGALAVLKCQPRNLSLAVFVGILVNLVMLFGVATMWLGLGLTRYRLQRIAELLARSRA